MLRASNDSFSLNNDVTPRVGEARSSKRLNRESHSQAPFPSERSVRGGKTSGRDEA